MPAKKYVVRLSAEEREDLNRLVRTGKTQAYRIRHAQILLKTDADGPDWDDARTAEAVGSHVNTVYNVRRRFVEQGADAAVEREKQDPATRRRKFDGAAEARLIAESCSAPPAGRGRWTLKLLADRLVTLEVVDSVSPETVRKVLKKTS